MLFDILKYLALSSLPRCPPGMGQTTLLSAPTASQSSPTTTTTNNTGTNTAATINSTNDSTTSGWITRAAGALIPRHVKTAAIVAAQTAGLGIILGSAVVVAAGMLTGVIPHDFASTAKQSVATQAEDNAPGTTSNTSSMGICCPSFNFLGEDAGCKLAQYDPAYLRHLPVFDSSVETGYRRASVIASADGMIVLRKQAFISRDSKGAVFLVDVATAGRKWQPAEMQLHFAAPHPRAT